MVAPTFFAEAVIASIFIIAAFFGGRALGRFDEMKASEKIWRGVLLRQDDLVPGQRYEILAITRGHENPNAHIEPVFIIFKKKYYSQNPKNDGYLRAVILAIDERITDREGNLRFKAGDTIAKTVDGQVVKV